MNSPDATVTVGRSGSGVRELCDEPTDSGADASTALHCFPRAYLFLADLKDHSVSFCCSYLSMKCLTSWV